MYTKSGYTPAAFNMVLCEILPQDLQTFLQENMSTQLKKNLLSFILLA